MDNCQRLTMKSGLRTCLMDSCTMRSSSGCGSETVMQRPPLAGPVLSPTTPTCVTDLMHLRPGSDPSWRAPVLLGTGRQSSDDGPPAGLPLRGVDGDELTKCVLNHVQNSIVCTRASNGCSATAAWVSCGQI